MPLLHLIFFGRILHLIHLFAFPLPTGSIFSFHYYYNNNKLIRENNGARDFVKMEINKEARGPLLIPPFPVAQ